MPKEAVLNLRSRVQRAQPTLGTEGTPKFPSERP